MIASAMLYLAVTALVGSAAALAGEAGLRRLRLPTRWIWLGAMALGPLLMAAGLVPEMASWLSDAAPGSALVTRIDLGALTAGSSGGTDGAWLRVGEGALAVFWAGGTLLVALTLLRGHRTLSRERRTWRSDTVLGATVHVSSRRGPAVAGLVRPWIVLPEWVLALPTDELGMVLLHEQEHLRAGDSRLVAAALGLVAFAPWNPLSWWQLRRLRTAMELDCDRRVLARRADPRAYVATLLAVAAGISPEPSLSLAAFSENARSLRTRIIAMTTKRSRWTAPAGALLVVLAALVGIQACDVQNPVADAPSAQRGESPATSTSERPVFTPFSVEPSLVNPEEVGRSLESEYPPLLRDAGVGGTVGVRVHISEQGAVIDAQVDESSGHPPLDQAAVRVARVLRFNPALNRDQGVAVWASIPITFEP